MKVKQLCHRVLQRSGLVKNMTKGKKSMLQATDGRSGLSVGNRMRKEKMRDFTRTVLDWKGAVGAIHQQLQGRN